MLSIFMRFTFLLSLSQILEHHCFGLLVEMLKECPKIKYFRLLTLILFKFFFVENSEAIKSPFYYD